VIYGPRFSGHRRGFRHVFFIDQVIDQSAFTDITSTYEGEFGEILFRAIFYESNGADKFGTYNIHVFSKSKEN
jgi:hypothetical protein